MGLIKNIGNAVKSEVRDYLLKIVEAEKEAPKNPEAENVQKPAETKAGQPKVEERPAVKEEKVQPERVEEVEEVREKPRKKEIYPISNDLEFVRVSYKKGQDSVIIPKELAELIKMLPLDEYACFVKLYCLYRKSVV